ncbi:MAG TPA: GNAT family protein [Terriglobia bacterium]|nr:GNAT family protein [Terriglobia bacterium]
MRFKPGALNNHSRKTLVRIGAKEEGTFRNHMITSTGRLRHSVYYSIIASEWPAVKTHLEEKLSHLGRYN